MVVRKSKLASQFELASTLVIEHVDTKTPDPGYLLLANRETNEENRVSSQTGPTELRDAMHETFPTPQKCKQIFNNNQRLPPTSCHALRGTSLQVSQI